MENDSLIIEYLTEIKKSKKYKTLSDEIVLSEIRSYLKKNPYLKSLDDLSLKEIKKNLHRLYSSYQTNKKKKKNFILEKLSRNPEDEKIKKELLGLVVSTKERLYDYPDIYNNIFKITKKPKTIIDLGCGLNPLSFPLMRLKDLNYYCYDIDLEDIKFLNEYFSIQKQFGLNAHAETLDVRDIEKIKSLPISDIVFMFKLLDLIDNNKYIEELILELINKSEYIVISFSTKTLSGRSMNLPRRKGFELMLERLKLKFKKFSTSNEIFYVISK